MQRSRVREALFDSNEVLFVNQTSHTALQNTMIHDDICR
jgi:hypothetical protein